MGKKLRLESGTLGWFSGERITDRYGFIFLYDINDNSGIQSPLADDLDGVKGALIAKVDHSRQSGHIGDFFLGVGPTMPEVGEEIVLGSGTLRTRQDSGYQLIGLEPDDSREYFWLNVANLYRAHDQDVTLFFEKGRKDNWFEEWDDSGS